jgi:hypothetical protein
MLATEAGMAAGILSTSQRALILVLALPRQIPERARG